MPALVGHLPDEVLHTMRGFLDFCYLVRRSVLTDETLEKIDDSLARFYKYRVIFQEMGVRESFSVPRLHSVVHYKRQIRDFGAPNGLCSSITESKHIDAVKKPWRRSNRFNALGQMLKTNSRLDKLRASRLSFFERNMLKEIPADDADNMLLDDARPNANDDEAVDGPTILGFVSLAHTPREPSSFYT